MSFQALELLERRIHEAAERLTALREDNAVLRARVAELEKAVAAPGRDEAEAWSRERDDLRQRVEQLVERLAGLLDD